MAVVPSLPLCLSSWYQIVGTIQPLVEYLTQKQTLLRVTVLPSSHEQVHNETLIRQTARKLQYRSAYNKFIMQNSVGKSFQTSAASLHMSELSTSLAFPAMLSAELCATMPTSPCKKPAVLRERQTWTPRSSVHPCTPLHFKRHVPQLITLPSAYTTIPRVAVSWQWMQKYCTCLWECVAHAYHATAIVFVDKPAWCVRSKWFPPQESIVYQQHT